MFRVYLVTLNFEESATSKVTPRQRHLDTDSWRYYVPQSCVTRGWTDRLCGATVCALWAKVKLDQRKHPCSCYTIGKIFEKYLTKKNSFVKKVVFRCVMFYIIFSSLSDFQKQACNIWTEDSLLHLWVFGLGFCSYLWVWIVFANLCLIYHSSISRVLI